MNETNCHPAESSLIDWRFIIDYPMITAPTTSMKGDKYMSLKSIQLPPSPIIPCSLQSYQCIITFRL